MLEAAVWLLVARVSLVLFRFSRIASFLGKLHDCHDADMSRHADPLAARRVAWAIDRAARLFPFPLVCLPRALAAWKMLCRRKIDGRIHFGVVLQSDSKSLRTHAWVDACGVEVTGYPEAHACKEIGFYAR